MSAPRLTYRRRASPLHAAHAATSGAYCAVLGSLAIAFGSPLALGALLLTLLIVAWAARVPEAIGGALRLGVPLGIAFALLNPLVSQYGLTVLARLGHFGPFGEIDVTLEALVYGLVIALKIVTIVLAARIAAAAVNPDELLGLFRRISFHSALTAALTTRMFFVLAGDAQRLADAQRCRPDRRAHPRVAVLRAVVAGALDRALDVAATLEVRGYGTARRARGTTRPLSRHDLGFGAAVAALIGLAVPVLAAGLVPFEAYPRLAVGTGAVALLLCALIAVLALLPFADRRGIEL
jgi:energy-coupling factor transport system permease protein